MKYGAIPTNIGERVALALGAVPLPAVDALFGMMKTRVLMAGVSLGIFAAIADGERDAAALARELALDEDTLDLLLRTLVLIDYLEQRDARYRLTPLAQRTVRPGAPMNLTHYLRWNYMQWDLVSQLEAVVRTGKGVDFHATMDDAAAWGEYQRGMLEIARLDAKNFASRVPVRAGATRLLDIAGSHGLLGAAICRAHPPMTSTVLDLPQAVAHARELARQEGIADLVEHREGNLTTDDFGRGYDVVLLANILHHFTVAQAGEILRRAHAALVDGGTIAIWEIERPKRGSKVTEGDGVALFFRITSTAGAYHGDEYAEMLRAAGCREVRVRRPLLSPGKVLVWGRT